MLPTGEQTFATLKRQTKKSEFDSRSVNIEQKPPILMPGLNEPFVREPEIVSAEGLSLNMEHLELLAFAEEPIKILIHRSQDGLASKTTDYIAVNGIAAEMLFKNGWVPVGYLPRGMSLITKRKYVEVIAKAKLEAIRTDVIERDNDDPQNFVQRTVTHPTAFTVLEDKNPRGADWLTGLLSVNY